MTAEVMYQLIDETVEEVRKANPLINKDYLTNVLKAALAKKLQEYENKRVSGGKLVLYGNQKDRLVFLAQYFFQDRSTNRKFKKRTTTTDCLLYLAQPECLRQWVTTAAMAKHLHRHCGYGRPENLHRIIRPAMALLCKDLPCIGQKDIETWGNASYCLNPAKLEWKEYPSSDDVPR